MEISHPYIEDKDFIDSLRKHARFGLAHLGLATKARALLMLYLHSLEDGYSKTERQTIWLKFLEAPTFEDGFEDVVLDLEILEKG